MTRRVNKDCPFTAEELDEFRAALYNVNTSFHCCNAAPVDWAAGWQRNDIRKTRLESHNLPNTHVSKPCDAQRGGGIVNLGVTRLYFEVS